MELLIHKIAEYGEQMIHFSWLPLLIWTILTGIMLSVLRFVPGIHPQYQYHSRLALLFALPAGFIAISVIQFTGSLLSAPPESLSIISVAAPFELTVSANTTSFLTTASIVYSAVIILFSIGLILFAYKNIVQWFQLVRLKSTCTFLSIQDLDGLDYSNLLLTAEAEKNIQISFLDKEIIPVTFGIIRPVILLPDSLKSDSEKLNLVLRHELTHINQNDFLSNVIISFTQIIFWFHPVVHFLKRELIDYREIRCDSLVLSKPDVSKKKYASLLLELLPMPNINKELSVNMAQESSNLKKRIQMITQQKTNRPIPKRSSIAIFAFIILSTAVAMSCTDMQTENVFDEEELDLMTNIDRTGEQGFHEIIIYMSEEEQANRHESKLEQLRMLEPEHIEAIQVWKGDQAVEKFGSRGERGVIQVRTKLDAESYNNTLKALGMKTVTPESLTPQNSESSPQDDFYVVVEKMPELIGGLEQIMTQIKYPEEAKQAGIEGRVYVQFIVNKEGNVEDAKVIRGIGGGADEEALRVVKQAKFEPGYQRGEPVRVQYSLPIFFKLANNSQGTSSRSESENQEDGLTLTSYTSTEIGDIEVDYKSMEVDVSQSGNIIEGKVVDAETGVPLIGANIIIQGSNTGTSTDQNGRFTISTENADISNFLVSHIGYQTASYRL